MSAVPVIVIRPEPGNAATVSAARALGLAAQGFPLFAVAAQPWQCPDPARYDAILSPTVAVSRHVFGAPTRFYKTGIVFLAYLNGHQSHFAMIGGQQSARSIVHLAELFRLADRAGLLRDPEQALERMRPVLTLAGLD